MSEIRTVPELLIQRTEENPHHEFLFFRDEKITLGELYKKSASVAGALKEFGVKKDDKVALMLPNAPEFLYSWFGCALLGATMVPLNTALKGEGLKYIVNHSDSKVFIFDEQFFPQIAPQVRELKNISRWISSSGITAVEPDIKEYTLPRNTVAFEKILSSSQLETRNLPARGGSAFGGKLETNDADIMAIIYTSGTTGLPKGVMLPHYSYINTGTFYVEDIVGAVKDDIIYTSLPLFHCNAEQFTVMGTLLRGCKMVLAEKFSASNFWDEIRKYNATIFHYIGAIATILYKQPQKKNDADNPARIAMGGACPKEIWKDFEKRFSLQVIEGYGLTETGTCSCHIKPHDTRIGSVGKPARHSKMKIVDDNDNEVPENTPGEIVAKETIPHTMMKGYYKETQKTEESMRGGWFHSGDRGMKDADGYFYFMDRLKDCIRRRGENISSFEIEKIVNAHPKVLESAAVGVPSELGEDDVKIYVVVRDGQKIMPEEILAWCEDKMAYFMVPRYVAFRESFPKTETQRVQKFELRKVGIGDAWDREKAGYKLKK